MARRIKDWVFLDQTGKGTAKGQLQSTDGESVQLYDPNATTEIVLTDYLSSESQWLSGQLDPLWQSATTTWLGTGAQDSWTGDAGSDVAFALDAPDVLKGVGGDDLIIAGKQDDHLYGGAGNDILLGEEDNDTLDGGTGDDLLVGGSGADNLDGGAGIDTAVFFGSASNYSAEILGDTVQITSLSDPSDSDGLTNVEMLQFGSETMTIEQFLYDQGLVASPTEPLDLSAETPWLEVAPQIVTTEGQTEIPLTIDAGLTDIDGSETLSVTVSGLPEGATLSAGTAELDGSWTLTQEELPDLMIQLPTAIATTLALVITATSVESASGATASFETTTILGTELAMASPSAADGIDVTQSNGVEIHVGAHGDFQDLQTAVDAAQAGDTIIIDAGTYDFGQVKITKDLRIIGEGDVTLTSAEKVYKGLLVTTAGVDLYVENITFTGAVSWDRNGAGIRHQGSDLIVVNSYFIGNENGILATADGTGDVTITGSHFIDNGYGDGYSHGIYIKDVGTLTVDNSEFIGTNIGHHIKSMAETTIVTNSLLDDADGQTSYSIEASFGGDLIIENNTIIQSSDSDNPTIISYSINRGGEAGDIVISGNTITNAYSNGLLLNNLTESVATVDNNTIDNIDGGTLRLFSGLAVFTNTTVDGVMTDVSYLDGAVSGTVDGDYIYGTDGNDVIAGLEGDDYLYGGSSASDLGKGKDILDGGAGNDYLFGGKHNDTLLGGDGQDYLNGGADNDLLAGGADKDTLVGDAGGDSLSGGAGDDVLLPGAGADIINGGDGVDIVVYEYAYEDYNVSTAGGRWFVQAPEGNPDWGKDRISNSEFIQFSNGVLDTNTGDFHSGVILLTFDQAASGWVELGTLPTELQASASSWTTQSFEQATLLQDSGTQDPVSTTYTADPDWGMQIFSSDADYWDLHLFDQVDIWV